MPEDVNFMSTRPRVTPQGLSVGPSVRQEPRPMSSAVSVAPPTISTDLDFTDPRMARLLDLMRKYFAITSDVYDSDAGCRHAVLTATALCLTYGFFPGRHVRVRCIAGKWTCEDGYRAWLDSANEMARLNRYAFDIEVVQMTDDEVQQYMDPTQYTKGDVGYFARVLRSDVLEMWIKMGRTYNPKWSMGFWRQRAYQETGPNGRPTGQWLADPIYEGRLKEYTAEVRASKMALMACFSLTELNDKSMDERLQRLTMTLEAEMGEREMKRRDKTDPRISSILASPDIRREENGDILYA